MLAAKRSQPEQPHWKLPQSRLADRRAEIQQAGEVLQGWEVEDYSVLKPSGKTYW
jgi:hypothetical protein